MLNHQHNLAALRKPFAPRMAAGLSLVELLVGVAMGGLVIIAGASNIVTSMKAQESLERKAQVAEAAAQIQRQFDCQTTIETNLKNTSDLSSCLTATAGSPVYIAAYSLSAIQPMIVKKSTSATDFTRLGNLAIRVSCEVCSMCPGGYGLFARYMMMQSPSSSTPKRDPLTNKILDINTPSDWTNLNGNVPLACNITSVFGLTGDPMTLPAKNSTTPPVATIGPLDPCPGTAHTVNTVNTPSLAVCMTLFDYDLFIGDPSRIANGFCGCWQDAPANRARYTECYLQNIANCAGSPPIH